MKPNKKEKKDKDILVYSRELDKLHRITREAPLIPLEKPYQNGWTKFFVLRDDYTRRNDAHVFRNILKVVSTEAFCRKMNFLDRRGKPYGPGLRIIGKNEWEMLGWTDQYKKYFHYGLHPYKGVYGTTGVQEGWKLLREFFFVEAVKPHFVTHLRTHYPEVEARKAYIYNKFERGQLWKRYGNLKGWSRGSSDWRCAKDRYEEVRGTKEIEDYCKYGEE